MSIGEIVMKVVRDYLKNLLTQRLREGGILDEVGASIALTILETYGVHSDFTPGSVEVCTRRGLCAVRLLNLVEIIQQEVHVGNQPFPYPLTKEVLWRAVAVGYYVAKRSSAENLLRDSLLAANPLMIKRGLEKEKSELELFAGVLKESFPFARAKDRKRKLRGLLVLARSARTSTLVSTCLHQYASELSNPVEVAQLMEHASMV
jgi:hypothetical protein